jgi:signal transduction histidine kinase
MVGRKGNRLGYYYALAYFIFFLLCSIEVVYIQTGSPGYLFELSHVSIGILFEVIALAFLLVKHFQWERADMRTANEKAQQELLEKTIENERIVREQNLVLEETVARRTAQIEEQKAILEKSLADLKMAQAKLVESEKMASLGQLTAGVAHEINNPINFVSVGVKNLIRNFEEAKKAFDVYLNPKINSDEAAKQLADEKRRKQVFEIFDDSEMLFKSIQNGVDRTINIVKSLRNFSRLDEGELKPVNLHEGLESTLEILQSQIKKKAEVVKKYGQLPPVECAAGKINQVFMNILNNALQAMEGRGVITLETKHLADKNEVLIAISDTGKGMSDEVKRRLFEPFFTTKPVGEGTGLGLSISYGIIEEHKGRIEVESELGKGSMFRIFLPVKQSS